MEIMAGLGLGAAITSAIIIVYKWCVNCHRITDHERTQVSEHWEQDKCKECGESQQYKTS